MQYNQGSGNIFYKINSKYSHNPYIKVKGSLCVCLSVPKDQKEILKNFFFIGQHFKKI